MKLLAVFVPIIVLGGLGSAPAAEGDPERPQNNLDANPKELFRFHAGAPLLAPVGVAADGSICLGTVDGYVHVLAADGSFRWSYAVRGAVTRRPISLGELWLVATNVNRVYALTSAGNLFGVFSPPSPVASELASDAQGTAYFIGADRFLYGVSAHGSVSMRAAFGAAQAGPTRGTDGAIWAKNQLGDVIRARGQELRRMPTGTSLEFGFGSLDTLRDPEGHEWHARSDGAVEYRDTPSAAPTLLALSRTPLLSATWSTSGHYVLVGAREGLVVALTGGRDPLTP